MTRDESVRPNKWAVTTANGVNLTFALNRETFSVNDSGEPTFIEFNIEKDGEEIQIRINCSEAQEMARTILYNCIPSCQFWIDVNE